MTLEPVWDVKTYYALEAVQKAAEALKAVPDTDAAKVALLALRSATISAYQTIQEAEAETRRLALARVFA